MSILDNTSTRNKPAKFLRPGDSVTGQILSFAEEQLNEYGTETPQTWKDGTPKLTPIVGVQTEQRDAGDPDDHGARDVYCRGALFIALKAALSAAYPGQRLNPGNLIGATISIQYTGDKPGRRPGTTYKDYSVKIEPRPMSITADTPPADIPF